MIALKQKGGYLFGTTHIRIDYHGDWRFLQQ